ncbi:MAG: DUF4258 domain-containing protein [Proteobacteria bacterium]|nr:DUF4258 domain-containing protein [Pseudomonadota bacterium]
MALKSSTSFSLSHHAKEEMARRDISWERVKWVLDRPEQIVIENGGLKAYQSKIRVAGQGWFLIRVIVNEDSRSVVTVYRTSKIKKYWRKD